MSYDIYLCDPVTKVAIELDTPHRMEGGTYCIEQASRKEIRELLASYSGKATDLVCPGGKYLSEEEIENKILSDCLTAGRVLFNLRDRKLAKYIKKE